MEEEKLLEYIFKEIKVGKKDMCPCGSGNKCKNCCGKNDQTIEKQWFIRITKVIENGDVDKK